MTAEDRTPTEGRPDLPNLRAVLAWAERSAAFGSVLAEEVEMATGELMALIDAAPAAEPVPPRTCARYWGSDGTMCATHNGRFATDLTNHCNRAAAEPVPLTLDELSMAKAVHEAFHSYALLTLTCMTKHRVKARRILAALASPDKGEPR